MILNNLLFIMATLNYHCFRTMKVMLVVCGGIISSFKDDALQMKTIMNAKFRDVASQIEL